MQDNDPLARGYDFDKIAVDSVREQARRESVALLNATFSRSPTKLLKPNQEIAKMMSGVSSLGANINPRMSGIALSEAYEEFTSASGIDVESRILRIGTGETSMDASMGRLGMGMVIPHGLSRGGIMGELMGFGEAQNEDKVFLLTATAKGQEAISRDNVKYGALQKGDGVTEFFKLIPLNEAEEEDRPLMAAVLLASGQIDEEMAQQVLLAAKLDPVEEQALIAEFAKATKVLGEKVDQRDAELQKQIRDIEEAALRFDASNINPHRRMEASGSRFFFDFDGDECIDGRATDIDPGPFLRGYITGPSNTVPETDPTNTPPEDTPPESKS